MQNSARNLFLRIFRQNKWQKEFSCSAAVRNEFLINSTLPDIVIPKMRFMDRLWQESAGFQDYVAIECAETKKRYTYRQLQKHMASFATSLRTKLGLSQRDVVGAMLPNCPEFTVVAFGTLQAGCILTTINPIYKEYEINHQVSMTEPKIMITIPECLETVLKGLKLSKSNARIVLIDSPGTNVPSGVIKFSEIVENSTPDYKLLDTIENKEDDVAFIPFSSGTTGLPKGVEISHRNLLAAIEVMQRKETCFTKLAHGDFQDVVPCILPFFHIYGLVVTLIGHFATGCKLVTMNKFSAGLFFDILRNENASLLYIVPPIGELYVKSPTIMKGYYKNEKATRESLTDDGFFKTGDLGHYIPGKGLYITDRIKELIKVKGMQVAPAELESILRSHPAVQEAAVIGVPHDFYGEAPKAFVIKKNGQMASEEELQNFVAGKVASFKKIEELVFVNDIPKTSSGKILRKDLKKMYA